MSSLYITLILPDYLSIIKNDVGFIILQGYLIYSWNSWMSLMMSAMEIRRTYWEDVVMEKLNIINCSVSMQNNFRFIISLISLIL